MASGTFKSLFYTMALMAVVIFSPSCSGSSESVGNVKVIHIGEALDGGYEFAKMSDYFSDIDYIPLQTDSSCMVGNVFRAKFIGDDIITVDSQSHRCMRFGADGSFKGTIGNRGNANGEYTLMGNFSVDPFSNELGIFDFRKVVIYDKDGNFSRNVVCGDIASRRGLFVSSVELFGNYCVMNGANVYTGAGYSLFIDENLNIVHVDSLVTDNGTDPSKKQLVSPGDRNDVNAYTFGNEIYIVNRGADTISSYDASLKKSPRYVLDYGRYVGDKRISIHGGQIYESDNLFLFGVSVFNNTIPFMSETNLKLCYLAYDKMSGKIRVLPFDASLNKFAFENDMDGSGLGFHPKAVGGNVMYQLVDSYYFIECAERSTSDKMKAVAATLTEESNPVLIRATLK